MPTRGVPEPGALRGLSRWPRRPLPTAHLQGSQRLHASVSLCVDPASPRPPARGAAHPCKVRKPKPRGYGDVTEASPLRSGTAPESGSRNIQEAPQKQGHQASVLAASPAPGESLSPLLPREGGHGGQAGSTAISALPPTIRPPSGPSFLLGMRGWRPGYRGLGSWAPYTGVTQNRGQAEAPRDVTTVTSPGPGAWGGEWPGPWRPADRHSEPRRGGATPPPFRPESSAPSTRTLLVSLRLHWVGCPFLTVPPRKSCKRRAERQTPLPGAIPSWLQPAKVPSAPTSVQGCQPSPRHLEEKQS